MNKLKFFFIFLLNFFLFPLAKIFAFCPFCVVTTGAATGFFRWLGFDDTIIGLWIGGFIFSLAVFSNDFLRKKIKSYRAPAFLMICIFYLLNALILSCLGALTLCNKILGINKIIFGMIIGGLVLFFASFVDKFLREQNQGKVFISYQKVLLATGLLLIVSLFLYLVFK